MSWYDTNQTRDISGSLNFESISTNESSNQDDDAQSESSLTRVTKRSPVSLPTQDRSPGGKKGKNKKPVDLTKFKSSFEKNHWSDHNEIWREHIVHDPRLPTPSDSKTPWDTLNYPSSIDAVLGRDNRDTKVSLNTIVANGSMRNVILHGPSGCGKSAMVQVYVKEFYTSNVNDGRITLHDCTFQAKGEDIASNVRKFIHDVEHWKKKLDHKVKKTGVEPTMKAIVIDNLDKVPSGKQQNVRQLVEAMDEDGVRFVCSCRSPKDLVDGIRQRAYILQMKRLPQKDMLALTLKMCVREDVGFEKGGFEELFKYTGVDMGKILRTTQRIFTKYAYLSYENVLKEVNPEEFNKPTEVDAVAAILPLNRCPKCTLIPPCRHITPFDLAQQGRRRRRELPKREDGSMTCSHFAENGTCPTFNKLGRCSCNHPLNIHTINYPPSRCLVCSLPKPCGKCEYTIRRADLTKFVLDNKGSLFGSYKTRKISEVLELANLKARISGAGGDKIHERACGCVEGLEKIAVQLDQIDRWLKNNEDCIDNEIYTKKRKWIGKNVEEAFYAVDRALYEWRARRDRTGSVIEAAGGAGGKRGRRGVTQQASVLSKKSNKSATSNITKKASKKN